MREEEVYCYNCGEPRHRLLEWRCSSCGGAFVIEHERNLTLDNIISTRFDMWRYSNALAPTIGQGMVSLGEGCTPMTSPIIPNIHFKLEYVMPTGSFKDRGSAATLSHIRYASRKRKIRGITEDSSGNAGASIAAYAAYLGIECRIYVPENAPEAKVRQISALGATVEKVGGTREEVARRAYSQNEPYYYVGHAWNPYFIEGLKTAAFEIAEQLRWSSPDIIYTPASAGTLLLGLIYGYKSLINAGIVDKLPKIVAVQPKSVCPIYDTFHNITSRRKYERGIADALTVTNPPRLREIVNELRIVNGDVVIVGDEEIKRAYKELGMMGIYVEPSGAVGYAALRREFEDVIYSGKEVVVMLTGSGLKSSIRLA